MHGAKADHAVQRAQRRQIFFIAHDELCDADFLRLGHRFHEQPIRLGRSLAGGQVIRPVVIQRIDVIQIDKIGDIDGAAFLGGNRIKLRLLHNHVLIGGNLISFDDVLAMHFLVLGRAEEPVLKPGMILIMQQMKRDSLFADRRM